LSHEAKTWNVPLIQIAISFVVERFVAGVNFERLDQHRVTRPLWPKATPHPASKGSGSNGK